MRNIISIPFGILSAIFFCACTSETEEAVSAAAYIPQLKSLIITIDNNANPYDNVGLGYRNLLSGYKAGQYDPDNYADVMNIVKALTNDSQLPATDKPTQDLLALCVSDPDAALDTILLQSDLSLTGKTFASGFIRSYENLSEMAFNEAYVQIVALENTIISSSNLPVKDQRVLMAVTSITRYSLYHSCCEDTDWKKSVGNIIAALAGALESNDRAAQYPLITSITGLEQIHF